MTLPFVTFFYHFLNIFVDFVTFLMLYFSCNKGYNIFQQDMILDHINNILNELKDEIELLQ